MCARQPEIESSRIPPDRSLDLLFPKRSCASSLRRVLPSKNWRPENVARLVVWLSASWLASGAMAIGLAASWRQDGRQFPPLALLAITGIGFHGACLLLVHAFLRAHRTSWSRGFGFQSQTGSAIRLALASTLLVAPVLYGIHEGAAHLLERWGWPPAPQESVELLLKSGWGGRLVIAFFAVVMAPVAEETLFRGIFFTVLRDAGWPRTSVWLVSLVFGLIHGNAAALLPLSLFGGFLAWLYVRTGNLLAPITAHLVFNLLPFVLLALGVDFGI